MSDTITGSILYILREKYNHLSFEKRAMHSKNDHAIICKDLRRSNIKYLFALKIIYSDCLVSFDVVNEIWLPDYTGQIYTGYTDKMQRGMLRKLYQIDFLEHNAIDTMMKFIDDFIVAVSKPFNSENS